MAMLSTHALINFVCFWDTNLEKDIHRGCSKIVIFNSNGAEQGSILVAAGDTVSESKASVHRVSQCKSRA